MKKFNIKADVAGQIRLFKSNMFKDKLAFIEEAIQNSQRAGATEIEVWFKDDTLIMQDNGPGLKSIADLFTIGKSGWKEEVDKENPFGLGFFSCTAMGDMVLVESNNFSIEFNIANIISTGKAAVKYFDDREPVPGFRVKVTDLDGISSYDVRKRLIAVTEYNNVKTIYNNEEIPKRNIEDTDGSKFARVVTRQLTNGKITGWLKPYVYADDGMPHTKLFAHGRFISDYQKYGLQGRLEIEDELLDLQAPDRKSIIYNPKYTTFRDDMSTIGREIMTDLIISGSDKDLDYYDQAITEFIDPGDMLKYIRFLVVEDEGRLDKAVDNLVLDRPIDTTADKKIFNLPEVEPQLYLNKTATGVPLPSVKSYESAEEKTGELLSDGIDVIYYVKKDNLLEQADRARQLVNTGAKVVILRNNVEAKAIKAITGAFDVSTLEQTTRLSARVANAGPADIFEERALRILALVGNMFSRKNIFIIGDVSSDEERLIGTVSIFKKKKEVFAIYDAEAKRILVNRVLLEKANLIDTGNKLTWLDRSFIARNINTISHELAHAVYNTKDMELEHYERQLEIQDKILAKIF